VLQSLDQILIDIRPVLFKVLIKVVWQVYLQRVYIRRLCDVVEITLNIYFNFGLASLHL